MEEMDEVEEMNPAAIDWKAVKLRTNAHPSFEKCICVPGEECAWGGYCSTCYGLMLYATAFMCAADIDPEKFQHNKAALEALKAQGNVLLKWLLKDTPERDELLKLISEDTVEGNEPS